MSLTSKIFLAMTLGIFVGVAGNYLLFDSAAAGGAAQRVQDLVYFGFFDVIGRIFVASLKLLVVPLVFVSLVCGTASVGQHGRMGVMAIKTLGLYLLTTALAISIAMSLALVISPGEGVGLNLDAKYVAKEPPPLSDTLVNIFPSNPVAAMAEGKLLQIIVFALLFGFAMSSLGDRGQRTLDGFNSINEVILQMVLILMRLAPYGVFCLLAKIFYETGFTLIADLAAYFMTVVLALLLHALGVYAVLLRALAKLNPVRFISHLRPVLMFAFSTASSSATMPITLEAVEKRLGVKRSVGSFTVPLGATINMDGTAIMQGVATVFIAQAYQIDIGLVEYLTVILTATLASIGTAAVPGVGLVTLALVLQQVGLPVEGIALIIGVDRLLDMLRTAVNVTGDSTVSCIVARSEAVLDDEIFNSDNALDDAVQTASPQ